MCFIMRHIFFCLKVLRAIRNMEPAWEKVNGRKFALVEYKDAKGERRKAPSEQLASNSPTTLFRCSGAVGVYLAGHASMLAAKLDECLEVVVQEPVVGHLLVLGAWRAVVGIGIDADAAARREEADDLDVLGLHEADKVLHDGVHAVLVEIAVVAETEEVELQALGLHHQLGGQVVDAYLGEVGLSGDGAQRRELGAVEAHPVVVVGMSVLKCLQQFGCVVGRVLRLTPQRLQMVVFAVHRCAFLNLKGEPLSRFPLVAPTGIEPVFHA